MHVSVRELKNHLSMYLNQVKRGEAIIVTSHRVPLARLSPIPQSADENIQQLLQIEGVSWNGKKPKGGKKCPILKGSQASDAVLKDRQ